MNKQSFIFQMDSALQRLKPEERKEILADFEEHFANGLAGGKTEEEVARELGDPAVLAAQYTEDLPEPSQPVTASGVARGILAGFALILFDAIIALPVTSVLLAVWVTLWSVVVALLAVSLALFAVPFISWGVFPGIMAGVGCFLLGIAALALTALAGIGMVYVSKWFFKGLAEYVKAHIRIIKGGARA